MYVLLSFLGFPEEHPQHVGKVNLLEWLVQGYPENSFNEKQITDKFEYDNRNTDKPSSVIAQLPHMHAVGSLRSDRARAKLGRYVAIELEPNLGRHVATERSFRSVAT
ncbi:hypothetical protein F2Q70_00021725 [Brassica cretica]|uniref:Uncharacterized protein n=2 Tax=Brassica cretica TaxID=69181 RepID=A0A8S9GR69_BRACR|nr:hypothetical protein F2Q70_00021725 [Brassica cretica]KAF2558480.1 hypothetical protein F2Q68_00015410 [Brassica cretica]KAF3610049.1 hypothetical protein DY000_02048046 [Brassica cretica]